MDVNGELNSPEKDHRYPLDRSLGGSQNRDGRADEEKISLLLPGIEQRSSRPYLRHYTDWATPDDKIIISSRLETE
jgi:hypothetical protein